jgi:hypothetical protein
MQSSVSRREGTSVTGKISKKLNSEGLREMVPTASPLLAAAATASGFLGLQLREDARTCGKGFQLGRDKAKKDGESHAQNSTGTQK